MEQHMVQSWLILLACALLLAWREHNGRVCVLYSDVQLVAFGLFEKLSVYLL